MKEKEDNSPKIGVISIVLKKKHVLMVQRKNYPDAGLWSYPGGHLNFGEKVFEASKRETFEETGIIVNPKRFLTNLDIFIKNNDQLVLHYLLVAISCDYVKGNVVAKDDAKDAKWFEVDYILKEKLPMSENVIKVLKLELKSKQSNIESK